MILMLHRKSKMGNNYMDTIKKIARNGMRLLLGRRYREHKAPKKISTILCNNHIGTFDGPLIAAAQIARSTLLLKDME